MRNILAAFGFLIRLSLKQRKSYSSEYITINDESIGVDIYDPIGPSKGCILTINGFAPLGNRDERFLHLNSALAGIGFTVVSPHLPGFCNLQIDSAHVSLIQRLTLAISHRRDLTRSGKVAVLAPSFAGGMTLIAAATASSEHISAICTIGTYANVDALLDSLMLNQNADEYGRLIILRNFLHLSAGRQPRIATAITHILHDSYFHARDPVFPDYERTLRRTERTFLLRLREDSNFRMRHWKRIIKKSGKRRSILAQICAMKQIKKMDVPVCLIHGCDDNVVPASESRQLHEKFQLLRATSRLILTPLISHGDSRRHLSDLPAAWQLAAGFAFFFKNASTDSQLLENAR